MAISIISCTSLSLSPLHHAMALLQACATVRPMPACIIATLRSSSEASSLQCHRVAFAPLDSRGQPFLQTSRRVHVLPLAAAGDKFNSIQERDSSLETQAGEPSKTLGDELAAGHKLKSIEILLGRAVGTAAVGALLLSSGPALADEGVEAGGEVGEVVANNTISVLFVAATLGLIILTIGVIYLSIQDYLEKRQLEGQAKAGQEKKAKKSLEVVKAARSGPKGFGGKRPTKDDN